MIEDFNGRVAVVTGGASGIGKAIAAASKAAGMTVFIADVEKAVLDATCEELRVDGNRPTSPTRRPWSRWLRTSAAGSETAMCCSTKPA
jgi:NAD(P)-dependent dehydrogenase (short-subunit alcohol dehydrogenase family)